MDHFPDIEFTKRNCPEDDVEVDEVLVEPGAECSLEAPFMFYTDSDGKEIYKQ